jgi:hypothetical protein
MLARSGQTLWGAITVSADGGDTGITFAQGVKTALRATVQITKRSNLHQFTVIPKTAGGRGGS